MVAGGCESKSPGRWTRRAWRTFCRHGIMLIELRRDRGTIFISRREIVMVDELTKQVLAQFRDAMLVEAIY